MAKKEATIEKTGVSVEDKLKALFELQQIDSKIDRIKIVRGELPMEVRDLEDEIEGLETRINNYQEESKGIDEQVSAMKLKMKEADAQIKKYEQQQMNVKNNREYDSLTKEIEYQNLEKQLAEKKIKEYGTQQETKKAYIETSEETLEERKKDLEAKKNELESIIAETKKEEEQLVKKSEKSASIIEERLLLAYRKIRANARNGLAVVTIQRDSCGGCFNKIPPQRQLDIRQRKKIIVCEHCGRILVDNQIAKPEEILQ
jgi:uncharacterized protein